MNYSGLYFFIIKTLTLQIDQCSDFIKIILDYI